VGAARFNGGIGLNRDAFGGRALDVLGGGIRLVGSTNGSFEVNGGNSTFAINTVGGLDGLTLTDTSNAIFKFSAASYTYSFFLSGGNQRFEIRDQNQAGATRFAIVNTGSVLIGTTTDIASSKLTIESTTQGFLPPRMTTTQKNAIATPAAGLVVYDTTLGKLCVRGAAAWETITSV
jgi:hypothetical protein